MRKTSSGFIRRFQSTHSSRSATWTKLHPGRRLRFQSTHSSRSATTCLARMQPSSLFQSTHSSRSATLQYLRRRPSCTFQSTHSSRSATAKTNKYAETKREILISHPYYSAFHAKLHLKISICGPFKPKNRCEPPGFFQPLAVRTALTASVTRLTSPPPHRKA